MTIYFYKADQPYGCFSNFSPHGIVWQGRQWPTVEHYYQAQKFAGTPQVQLMETIYQAPTPGTAAHIGRDPHHRVRGDWETVKWEVMYVGVKLKFSHHRDLQAILLNTGHEELVENSPVDYYWGCGEDHSGLNHLGRLLMQIRQELRQELRQEICPTPRP